MTDIEQKALALVNEVANIGCYALCDAQPINLIEALCRAIEQHEAFRQEVSDIVHHYVYACGGPDDWEKLNSLIIPKPKPDPLVAALEGVTFDHYPPNDAKTIRAALEARGLKIVEVKNDDTDN